MGNHTLPSQRPTSHDDNSTVHLNSDDSSSRRVRRSIFDQQQSWGQHRGSQVLRLTCKWVGEPGQHQGCADHFGWHPKFTFYTFTPDPNLHKSQIYTGPKFTQTQIYTGPIFTQPRFTQIHFRTLIPKNPNLHKTRINTTQLYTSPKFTQNFFFKFCSNFIK